MTEDRGSDKHGPRIDEELAEAARPMEQGGPSDARAEEDRQQEAPDDFDPVPDSRVGRAAEGSPVPEIADDPKEAKREIAASLEPSIFPASRAEVLESAETNHAREPVIRALAALPPGETWGGIEDLWRALTSASQ